MDSNTPEPSRSNTQQPADEADLKMREIAIKERELALKEQEVRSRIAIDRQGTWLSSSFLVAVAGLFGTGFGAALQGYSNFQLERQKFEFSLIQKALETTDQKQAVDRLVFLSNSGVLKSLDAKKLKDIAENEPEKLPLFPVSSLIPEAATSNARDKTRDLERQIVYTMQTIDPNSLVSFRDLNVQLQNNSNLPILQPIAKTALKKAIEKRGTKLSVLAAYRPLISQHLLVSCAQQESCPIRVVARIGESKHHAGLAIDIEDFEGWKPYLQAEGWKWDPADPPHFEIDVDQASNISKLSIQAFQKLWNQNYPADKIPENGIYNTETQERLNKTPVSGFPIGEKCSAKCGFNPQ
jgi:LAS superfamily LD-carboxypeptidase LdcB